MRAGLQAVVAASDARTLNDNTAFADAFARVLDTSDEDRKDLAEAVWEYGLQARDSGEQEEADKLFEAAINGRGKGLCVDDKEGRGRVVEMREGLLALRTSGGYAGGVGDKDLKVKVATVMFELASDLNDRGDYDKALALYKEALVLYTEVHGHNSPDVGLTIRKIGVVYCNLCKYDEALEQYHKAEKVFVASHGYEHPDVAKTYNNIASVYDDQGKYDEALVEYQKSLDIKIQVLGHDHLDVAKAYNNIALVYNSQGKYDEALVEYQKSLDIKIRVVGHGDPIVATTKYNTAKVYKNQGKLGEALQLYLECEQIYTKIYGTDHSETLDAASQAASCIMST
jgi:tetratricopeptide (TPR) repeat protein